MSAIYRAIFGTLDKFVPKAMQPLWNHTAGPKTVFFWAPMMKWALVVAGLSDLSRPVEKLSGAQTASLAATGLIWSRFALVIIPKNYTLFTANCFVALINCSQLMRIARHNYSK